MNGSFDIAFGRSRKETHWKNKELTWEELVKKLSKTHKTAETLAEYATAHKDRQDEIKDIGGFVGGFITGGRRLKTSILHRQLITLDIDFGDKNVWDIITLCFNEAAVLYSTHKHAPERPRLRLIMPLDRPVRPDEYQAISRKIAGILDIEIFDPTTFEPHRLMYWPSTSKDGEYLFEHQDGPWLNADKILQSYQDWTDESQWPISVKVDKAINREIKKQGDPLEKPGVLGAFCRARTIQETIEEYLSDEYAPAGEDRYSYILGSTTAGLKIYEDKFAYSHHGTDPTSGKLCNAFDLVRIHKFGLRDEDTSDNVPITKRPSFLAMLDLAVADDKVKLQLNEERMAGAEDDFSDVEEDPEWATRLDVDRKGNIYPTIMNISIILENDPALKNCFAIDDFIDRKVIIRDLPWRKIGECPYIRDEDEMNLYKYMEQHYSITTKTNIEIAFATHLDGRRYHPVREYLNGLKWDGKKRLDTLFIDYIGAENTEYIREVTRKSLIAAVARIFVPGIKFDYVPTFTGKEGIGKSTLIKKLGSKWFSDSFSFVMLKNEVRAYEQIRGCWLIEIGELTGMRKAELEGIKHFLAKSEDTYRKAFGHNLQTYKRQCVFFGSTNEREFLRDTTGNRRFWPIETMMQIPTKDIWEDLTPEEVDQVWAEAVTYFRNGESIHLSSRIELLAKEKQGQHLETDERIGIVADYLERKLPDDWNTYTIPERVGYIMKDDPSQVDGDNLRLKVSAMEIWVEAFGKNKSEITQQHARIIHGIMRNMKGWKEYNGKARFGIYGVTKGYYREWYVSSGNAEFEITDEEKN